MAKQAKRGQGPFIIEQSDGCSALSLPYRWITKLIFGEEKKLSFLKYCIEHDESYWYGGSRSQRWAADMKLFHGVRKQGESIVGVCLYHILASAMLVVTRSLGSPRLPTPFRWMYRERFSPVLSYTVDDVEKTETVANKEDADMIKTLIESPWTGPLSVEEAIVVYKEGIKMDE